MEKKTIIWHTRDEEPKDFNDVVLINSKTRDFASFFTPFHDISFEYDYWAYVSDLVAASKALDVAIDRLTHLAECPYQGGEKSVKLGVCVCAAAGLQEIESIMKGDK